MSKKKNMFFWSILGVTFLLVVGLLVFIYLEIGRTPSTIYHGESENGIFSTSFIRRSHQVVKDENYMISPYSIEIALSMLRDGSKGNTFEEIEKVAPKRSIKTLSVSGKVNIANAIFVRDLFKNDVRDDYSSLLKREYGAEFVYDSFQTPDKINHWVKRETNGMIEKILEDIDPAFVVGLANAVAMEEEWKTPFACEATYSQPFTKKNGKKYNASFMHNHYLEGASYYKGEGVEGVILPYKNYDHNTGKEIEKDGEQLDFVALLPKNLDSYIEHFTLDEVKNIDSMSRKAGSNLEISIGLPRFEFDYDFKNFKDTLIDMGIESVFGNADLSSMLDNHPDVFVSDAIHKTYVKVDESGTKAAAVTYFGIKDNAVITSDEKEHIQVVFDKPFVFMIKDHNSNEILFFGVVYEPEKWNRKTCE